MILRPYQREAVHAVADAHERGHQGVLLVVPTGGGKTVIYSEIAQSLAAARQCVLVVEPAVELVEQTRDKLRRVGVPRVGIIAAGWGYGFNPDAGALVQVATVQTLRSRPGAMLRRPAYLVFDEAHLAAAESYRMVRERWPEARRLGVTATPWRLDGEGFADLATEIVVGPRVRHLQAEGALTAFRTLSVPLTDYARAKRRPTAEFNLRAMADAYNRQQLVGDVVDHYLEHAAGRSAIVFAAGIEHSRQLRERFVAEGVVAEHLDGTTPRAERAAMIGPGGRLDRGQTQVVCNFGVLCAGFDCPRVSAIVVARATASKALWVQMAGRGLRPSPETGKRNCVILDHGGNALRHGNLAHEFAYSLDGRNRADEDEDAEPVDLGKTCPTCRTVIDASAAECEVCGHDFTAAAGAVPRNGPKTVDGALAEVDADAGAVDPEHLARVVELRGHHRKARAVSRAREWAQRWAR